MSDAQSTSDFLGGDRPGGKSTGRFVQEGSAVDGYRILSTLGEGGFGIVYLAESEPPLKRRVALKVIKPGMDSQQVIARFEAERQALAVMDHPNVAKVFDAGMTESGQSYFAMEHVKGVPLTDHCDRHKLGIQQRLKLFIDVCEGVQHAHQKGIIHRDLKPSNILVAIDGNLTLPKVIDFGVAKAVATPLTEKTLYTMEGQIIGTPEYMSPEQAEMTGQDIDTRTDVYSLGVVLYQLLTGCLPFSAEYLRTGGPGHMARVIREEVPKAPSTKITTLDGDNVKRVTDARQIELTDLKKSLRGDLDWIVLKAMEKDRQRRYETAHGLSMDVQRYLDHEPILARPPSAAYRLSKLVQRNRVAFVAAATWGLVEANRQRGFALTDRDIARKAQEQAESAERRAAARAAELERQVYLIRIDNVRKALAKGDLMWAAQELAACPESQRGWEWEFIGRRLRPKFSLQVPGGQDPIFTRDGKQLVAVGSRVLLDERKVLIWEVATGRVVRQFEHELPISFIALSPDERRVVCGTHQGTLFVWDLNTGDTLWEKGSHADRINGMAYSPNGEFIATASWDGQCKLIRADSGEELHVIGRSKSRGRKVTFSPDGRWIAMGFGTGGVAHAPVIIETSTGKVVATFPEATDSVPTFSPDGTLVATGGDKGQLKLSRWDGEELVLVRTWNASELGVASIDFSQDGKLLATGEGVNSGFLAKVWEVDTGKQEASVAAGGPVNWLRFRPGEKQVAIYTRSDGIRLWSYEEKDFAASHLDGGINGLTFSPNGERLLACAESPEMIGTVHILDAKTASEVFRIEKSNSLRGWMKSGDTIVVSDKPGTDVRVVDATDCRTLRQFRSPEEYLHVFASQVDDMATSVSGLGTVRLWNLTTGELELVRRFDEAKYGGRSFCVAASPDGRLLALSKWGQVEIAVIDLRKPEASRTITLDLPGVTVQWIRFSRDDKTLIVCGSIGTLALLDINTGQVQKVFRSHEALVFDAKMSPDGKRIAAVDTSGLVIVLDVESAQPVLTLDDADVEAWVVDWSADGRRIAAGYKDGTVKIWNLSD